MTSWGFVKKPIFVGTWAILYFFSHSSPASRGGYIVAELCICLHHTKGQAPARSKVCLSWFN